MGKRLSAKEKERLIRTSLAHLRRALEILDNTSANIVIVHINQAIGSLVDLGGIRMMPDLNQEEITFLQRGKRIHAIRKYKARAHCGLSLAMRVIRKLDNGIWFDLKEIRE